MSAPFPIVEIVSSETPCGVTFALNALVELDVLIYTGAFRGFWSLAGAEARVNPILQQKFSVWMPALRERSVYPVRDRIAFYWTHGWPTPQAADRRRILFVRDPRDALYSQYRRVQAPGSLRDFLEAPVRPVGGRMLERWALQQRLWRAVSDPERFMVVRFEDLKARPVEEMARILEFAGVRRSLAEIERAAELSQTDRVKKSHDAILGAGAARRSEVRKGMPFEWKESPGREDLDLYERGYAVTAMRDFGYEAPGDSAAGAAEDATPAAEETALAQRWLEGIYGSRLATDRGASERVRDELARCVRESGFVPSIRAQLPASSGQPVSPWRAFPVPGGGALSYLTFLEWRLRVLGAAVATATVARAVARRIAPPLASWIDRRVLAFELGKG